MWLSRNCPPSFSLKFITFLCVFQAWLIQSVRSWNHWKDLSFFLLLNMSVQYANFSQRWWCQKWNKGQCSLQPVVASTGAKGFKYKKNLVWKHCLIFWNRMIQRFPSPKMTTAAGELILISNHTSAQRSLLSSMEKQTRPSLSLMLLLQV